MMLMALFCPWQIPVTVDAQVIAGMAAVILLGTIIAFSCYLEGIRLVGPKECPGTKPGRCTHCFHG